MNVDSVLHVVIFCFKANLTSTKSSLVNSGLFLSSSSIISGGPLKSGRIRRAKII